MPKWPKTLCELATCLGVGPQDHKDRLLFRRRLEHFAQRREVEQRVGRRAVARRGADPSHAGMG